MAHANEKVSAETCNGLSEPDKRVSAGTLFEVINGGLDDTTPGSSSWEKPHKSVSAGTFWKKPLPFRRRDENGPEGLSEESFAAGRADALVMLCERFLAQSAQSSGAVDPYQVYVHVDPDTLCGEGGDHSHIESGPELNVETVRRICCDTGLIPVTENENGEILNVGRKTRTIPPALKRALRLRDQGCHYPGCTQYRHTGAHHIQHWADGGETKLSNLITLCRYHHRLMHEGGATLSMEDGGPQFHVPDLGFMPYAPEVIDPTELDISLEELNEAEGLHITQQTGDCQWLGESKPASPTHLWSYRSS